MSKAILEHILDGSIVIDSVEAFGSVVNEFPEHPELLKLFADFLTAKGKGPSAAQHYSKASEIFPWLGATAARRGRQDAGMAF